MGSLACVSATRFMCACPQHWSVSILRWLAGRPRAGRAGSRQAVRKEPGDLCTLHDIPFLAGVICSPFIRRHRKQDRGTYVFRTAQKLSRVVTCPPGDQHFYCAVNDVLAGEEAPTASLLCRLTIAGHTKPYNKTAAGHRCVAGFKSFLESAMHQ